MGFPLLYPLVNLVITPTLFSREPFGPSGPTGLTIHHSADRDMMQMLASENASGLTYHLVIDRDGKVNQTAYMDKTVWHAGNARWLGQSPNRTHIAVCLLAWGELTSDGNGGWKSWAGTPVDPSEVVQRPDNLTGAMGAWDAATPAQEASLEQVCRWAIVQGINVAVIAGHDEVAIPKGRKNDPGGTLSKTMKEWRAMLAATPVVST